VKTRRVKVKKSREFRGYSSPLTFQFEIAELD